MCESISMIMKRHYTQHTHFNVHLCTPKHTQSAVGVGLRGSGAATTSLLTARKTSLHSHLHAHAHTHLLCTHCLDICLSPLIQPLSLHKCCSMNDDKAMLLFFLNLSPCSLYKQVPRHFGHFELSTSGEAYPNLAEVLPMLSV